MDSEAFYAYHNYQDVDLETSLLITRLALDDLGNIASGRKGKGRADVALSDEEQALVLQQDFLTATLIMLEDSRLAQNFEEAIRSDQECIDQLSVLEQAAADDHRAALELYNGRNMPQQTESQKMLKDFLFLESAWFANGEELKAEAGSFPPSTSGYRHSDEDIIVNDKPLDNGFQPTHAESPRSLLEDKLSGSAAEINYGKLAPQASDEVSDDIILANENLTPSVHEYAPPPTDPRKSPVDPDPTPTVYLSDDLETSLLIARLVLEDLEHVTRATSSGNRIDATLSDEEHALLLQSDMWTTALRTLTDAQLANCLHKGTEYNHNLLDWEVEPRASGSKHGGITDYGFESIVLKGQELQTGIIECTVCCDKILKTASRLETTCHHVYCRSCLESLAEAFTRDESLYPLRCCEPIDTQDILHLLPTHLRMLFESKIVEYSTLSTDRIYCPNPRCSSFMGSSHGITSEMLCHSCLSSVCPLCKQPSHPGEQCGEAVAVAQLKELARNARWQTCPGCNAIVELTQGCYHVTCLCRTQFCYICAARWKSCGCDQFLLPP